MMLTKSTSRSFASIKYEKLLACLDLKESLPNLANHGVGVRGMVQHLSLLMVMSAWRERRGKE